MNSFLISVLITLLFVGLNTPLFLGYITNFVSRATKPESTNMVSEIINLYYFHLNTPNQEDFGFKWLSLLQTFISRQLTLIFLRMIGQPKPVCIPNTR